MKARLSFQGKDHSDTWRSTRAGGDRSIFDEYIEVKRPLIEMEAKIRRLELDMKHASGDELETCFLQPFKP